MTSVTDRLPTADTVAATGGIIRMGDFGVARGAHTLKTVGLGSCLAIVLFAPSRHLAALAHCMLPLCDDSRGPWSKYADTAVPALMTLLAAHGGSSPLSAALIGGASMFPGIATEFMPDIAAQNIAVARRTLASAGVPIFVEDVGGQMGRSVLVEPAGQRIMVQTIRGGQRWL